MSDQSDADYFFKTMPGKIIRSRRIPDKATGRDIRIASEVFETPEEVKFMTDLSEITIRVTPTGRQQIKASFFEDDRQIQTLTIQRYHRPSNTFFPDQRQHFSFRGNEIVSLKKFLAAIDTMEFDGDRKSQVSERELDEMLLGQAQAQRLIGNNAEVFAQLMTTENWEKDIVALGYRRKQLETFREFLNNPSYFSSHCEDKGLSSEAAWQDFFERNQWIFGYGLSYQFLSSIDENRLEQVVRGFAVGEPGKRTDALMRTRGAIGTLCFVEIKRHDTELLKQTSYRSGTWVPSAEVVGGVAQLQSTIRSAQRQFGDRFRPTDKQGSPTGKDIGLISPSSFLVVGSLGEFDTEAGPNMEKFACFEDYRRNVSRPEIVTFDELYERASYIVQHTEQ